MPLLIKFLPQIFFWQAFYFVVVILRGGQLIPWMLGTLEAILLMPKMIAKRFEINKKRKVSHSYMEQIIVESEKELEDSRARLKLQVVQGN